MNSSVIASVKQFTNDERKNIRLIFSFNILRYRLFLLYKKLFFKNTASSLSHTVHTDDTAGCQTDSNGLMHDNALYLLPLQTLSVVLMAADPSCKLCLSKAMGYRFDHLDSSRKPKSE